MTREYHFDKVTLLITHYNRSQSLRRLLVSFRSLSCSFEDIVVSDDGSKPEHVNALQALQQEIPFRLILADHNRGLGNNINKGQDAVNTPYTLYVQEDFDPAPDFPLHFKDACRLMDERPDLDIARFYAYYPYPYLKPYKNGFSEMFMPFFARDYSKIYQYSDHPHLRRSSFLEKFGRYAEGIKGDRTEYQMCISFIQKKGKGLWYDHFQELFDQKNSSEEPSTMTRSNWKNLPNPFIVFVRYLYRQVKYNYDIHFNRF